MGLPIAVKMPPTGAKQLAIRFFSVQSWRRTPQSFQLIFQPVTELLGLFSLERANFESVRIHRKEVSQVSGDASIILALQSARSFKRRADGGSAPSLPFSSYLIGANLPKSALAR
jgi:hypothetical protein